MEQEVTTSVAESVAAEAVLNPAEDAVALEAAPQVKKRKPINQQKLQDNLWGWIFCVPLIIGTVWFVYVAFILAFLLSFTTYNGTGTSMPLMEAVAKMGTLIDPKQGPFIWYKELFTFKASTSQLYSRFATVEMWRYLFNTVFYMIGIPIGMILSMFFAVCMSRDIRGGNLFRVLYYLPCVASSIAIVFTFKILFKEKGVINEILGLTDFTQGNSDGFLWMAKAPDPGKTWKALLDNPDLKGEFYEDPYWCQGIITKCVIIVMSVWKGLGGTIILYVAGLSGVNAATKEAAQIDGANGWQIFWKVTMPDLYPVIFYNIVTSVIGGLQIYAEPELLMSTSQAADGFMTTSGYVALIYRYGVNRKQFGQGAAYGIFLALIIFVLTLFQFWLDSRNKD